MRIPFTYLIQHELGSLYVGSRYGANCHPSQLLTTYFTSSKYVKPMILANPASWKIVRLVACSTTEEAVQLECEWQLEFRHDKRLLNKRTNNGKFINHGVMSDSTRNKISATRIQRNIRPSEETRIKLSLACMGRIWTEESKQKLRESKMGHTPTLETRLKISTTLSDSLRGAKNPNTTRWVLQDPQGQILCQPDEMTGRQWIESLGLSYQYLLKVLKTGIQPTSGKLVGWRVVSRQKGRT